MPRQTVPHRKIDDMHRAQRAIQRQHEGRAPIHPSVAGFSERAVPAPDKEQQKRRQDTLEQKAP